MITGDSEVRVWISDGKPLKPIKPLDDKKPTQYGDNYLRWQRKELLRKKSKQQWLDHLYKVKEKKNHTNDKRRYYRTEYLLSEHWLRLKAKKLKQNPKCQMCGSTARLDVHHKRYRNLYDVQLYDLMTLCRKCHTKIHTMIDERKHRH